MGLLAVTGLTVGSTVIVVSTRQSKIPTFCSAYGLLPKWEPVVIDGVAYYLAGLTDRAELESDCDHFTENMVLPDCSVYLKRPQAMGHSRGISLKPFFDDGTCDGSKGGRLLPGTDVPFRPLA